MAKDDSGNQNTDKADAQIKRDFEANKEAVMKMLLQNVINVNIEVPRVVKGDFEKYLS